jgi:hypothetical protein
MHRKVAFFKALALRSSAAVYIFAVTVSPVNHSFPTGCKICLNSFFRLALAGKNLCKM